MQGLGMKIDILIRKDIVRQHLENLTVFQDN